MGFSTNIKLDGSKIGPVCGPYNLFACTGSTIGSLAQGSTTGYVCSTTALVTGVTVGELTAATGYTAYETTYPASTSRDYAANPIIFTGTTLAGAAFDTNYWFKLTDTVNGTYIIEKVSTHQEEYYSFCLHCCDFDYNGNAIYVAP